ncbi:MAG: fumarylacetoacetase [Thermoanaerobaculia bacterium]|nr:fumarylacetoacetase [Thermoanaerobaculia bacterium]
MTYDATNPNETHDPSLRSWIASANEPDTDFPIQNLPFGVFRSDELEADRVGVAIGDQIVDVWACREAGAFEGLGADADEAARACAGPTLNALMGMEPRYWSALRRALQRLLRDDADEAARARMVLVAADSVQMVLPVDIGDYTDFYCSIHHATNVGSMFRPDNPLMPNYKHLPVGYHGRASSVQLSGTPVRRPEGQKKPPEEGGAPPFGPTALLDYELEVGFFVGTGNELGESDALDRCEDRIFGFCLVNDWSARDVQAWEYQPLGPFLAKSFLTSISPWIVTTEALAPFRVAAFEREADDPQPLPHLDSHRNRERGGIDLNLEVYLQTAEMRGAGTAPYRLSSGSFRSMYWTAAQMLTHHQSAGCNLQPGDLLASGTVSGPDKGSRGCLLELTWRGSEPLELPSGETRKFLEDGDEVVIRGACRAPGATGIGFGECRGVVWPTPTAGR